MSRVSLIRLKDEFDTEVRELEYRGGVIRVETWKSLGYRQQRKSAEVRLPDGKMRVLGVSNFNRTFSAYATNAHIFAAGKDLIREYHALQVRLAVTKERISK